MEHKPVMCNEVVDAVITDLNGTYVDATFGSGGHASAMLSRLGPDAHLIALDQDPHAFRIASHLSIEDKRVRPLSGRFGSLTELLAQMDIDSVAGIVMDVGVSSMQLDEPSRGFSFQKSGPLDMRMNPEHGYPASDWLNNSDIPGIASALRRYGEEKNARCIAKAIVHARPLKTTGDLVAAVERSIKRPDLRKHVATRVFQAVRIQVNNEIEELENGVDAAFGALSSRGRLAVVTFHGIEHRIVKWKCRNWVEPETPRRLPFRGTLKGCAKYIVKNAKPSKAEIQRNSRARSAQLRAIESAI